MTGRHEPTAVFCVGDLVAIGALNQARRMGLSVPDDVAIVGFDDIEMAGVAVLRPHHRPDRPAGMAVAAADLLVARLGGDQSPAENRTFPGRDWCCEARTPRGDPVRSDGLTTVLHTYTFLGTAKFPCPA